MEKRMVAGKENELNVLLNQAKGEICKEFEKVCMTDKSFDRMKKEMHDIFDELNLSLSKIIKQ